MSLLNRLKEDLKTAMKGRDQLRVKTFRSLIAAIENAGAVPVEPGPYEMKVGLGHDVPRQTVTDEMARRLIRDERDEYLTTATEYRGLGLDAEAAEFETRAGIVGRYLT